MIIRSMFIYIKEVTSTWGCNKSGPFLSFLSVWVPVLGPRAQDQAQALWAVWSERC